MTETDKLNDLVETYSRLLLNRMSEIAKQRSRTYGFEYEFLSDTPISLDHMEMLYRFLPERGYVWEEDYFRDPSGLSIAFEPGGQIEYHSPPFLPDDTDKISGWLEQIAKTNADISQELKINYIGTGYLPDRADAPLCLTSQRYKNLHSRLAISGKRGHEMMKGTASIHLHVVIRSLEELFPLFSGMCVLSLGDEFKMQKDRRDIWNHTDATRCGLPFDFSDSRNDPGEVIRQVVRFTLEAEEIGKGQVFYKMPDIDFDSFLYHLTTIFTDVRLNLKGPTMELRTLDSMPVTEFAGKLTKFTAFFEAV